MDIHDNNKIKPFEQLLIVLPPDSRNLLPYEYSKLMVDYESELIEYYPEKYCIKHLIKDIFKLPFHIFLQKVRDSSKNLKLSKEENIEILLKLIEVFQIKIYYKN